MDPSFKKGLNTFFLLKFSQTSFMTFQLGIEKSLDVIANYFIRCGLYIKKKKSTKFMAHFSWGLKSVWMELLITSSYVVYT